jgi:hypothetical protein
MENNDAALFALFVIMETVMTGALSTVIIGKKRKNFSQQEP